MMDLDAPRSAGFVAADYAARSRCIICRPHLRPDSRILLEMRLLRASHRQPHVMRRRAAAFDDGPPHKRVA